MMDRRRFLAGSGALAATAGLPCVAHGQASAVRASRGIAVIGGTYRQLGTQTLSDFLRTVRSRLPEGLDAANSRLKPPHGILAYCGATVWRDKYSLGIAGGHGDSHDDGHYAQDLASGRWEMLLAPSAVASASAVADAYGEWLPNRPASQHSYNHLVTVDDDIVQGVGYAIANASGGSPQAHRWSGATNSWQRYGTGGNFRPVPYTVLHDPVRNRLARFAHESGRSVDVIVDDDPGAAWVTMPTPWWPQISIRASLGHHADLDCFVLIDETVAPGQAWLMDGQDIERGWRRLSVSGTSPIGAANTGLEYVPPMKALAAASLAEPTTLYYLAPTGGQTDPWVWTRERFLGAAPAARWEVNPGVPIAPYGRVKWSSLLHGLVVAKTALAPTEVFTPAAAIAAGRR
ncbi:MAG: hypothetical protein IT518_04305 [Burkholderiales bacterium]|nr:hypothetical protein [Burkholderiales bacterium]